MNWKDWLYIPKSEKIAIVILLAIITILLAISFLINSFDKQVRSTDVELSVPDDYKEWKLQLTERKEAEKVEYNKQYFITHQAKMKEGETIELNSADTTLLKTIPGIGSGYANRIVKYREQLGGYADIEQLNEVWGMDTYLFSQISPYITLEPQHKQLYINRDSFEKLLKHPYLNYKQVLVIVDLRERKGAIKSLNRLALLDEFKKRDLDRLALYANFE